MRHLLALVGVPFFASAVLVENARCQIYVRTLDADSIHANAAVCRAFVNPAGHTIAVAFLIGPCGESFQSVLEAGVFSGNSLMEVRTTAGNLTPDVLYCYRARAIDLQTSETIVSAWYRSFRTNLDSTHWGILNHLNMFAGPEKEFVGELSFGIHTMASYCRDPHLGEQWIPPLPPQGARDFRLLDPRGFNASCMDQGLFLDMRSLNHSAQVDTYKLRFDPGDLGYPLRLSWSDVRSHYSGDVILRDAYNGALVTVDMKAENAVDVHEELPAFLITAAGPLNPGRLVTVAASNESPLLCSLHQNYPNPANPKTTIEFTLERRERVLLIVFDLLGREVETLVDEVKEPGVHFVEWHVRNVPSGVYLCRLEAGGFSNVRKLVVLR